jgi:hypothetical protein
VSEVSLASKSSSMFTTFDLLHFCLIDAVIMNTKNMTSKLKCIKLSVYRCSLLLLILLSQFSTITTTTN